MDFACGSSMVSLTDWLSKNPNGVVLGDGDGVDRAREERFRLFDTLRFLKRFDSLSNREFLTFSKLENLLCIDLLVEFIGSLLLMYV